jgi:murein L,D-transpeptidase YcbB/YkuD
VLAQDDRWTPETLSEVIEQGATRTIRLAHPVPVHLLYMTAWADESGVIQFRNDIYNRDRDLARALGRRRPNPPPVVVHPPDTLHPTFNTPER